MAIYPNPPYIRSKYNEWYADDYYSQTNYTNTWGSASTITYPQAQPPFNPPPPPLKTSAQLDMEWLKKEVDDICKAAYT